MIQKNTAGNAVVTGMNSNREFSLKASAKAFKILSSGLYKNKVLAPIREISTNAIDAHKQAKQTRKFIVHLPSALEPHFKVRDFGSGLSAQQIMGDDEVQGIYTTYFHSTKEEDADAIGCLGLGTKSPFAYTSSFTVTSFYDNKKSVYALYLDGDTPTVNLVGQEDSDEPTGLEVSFGVNSWDFPQFRSECQKLFSFWEEKDRPEIVGYTMVYADYLDGKTRGNGWILSDNTEYGVFTRNYFHVLMGNIPYRVHAYDGPNNAFAEIAEYSGLIFLCELGEVNFTASREELELDSHTVGTIVSRIDDFKQSIISSLEKQIDQCGSLWNARILAQKFKKSHNLAKNHVFKYKNQDLDQEIEFKKHPMCFYDRFGNRTTHKRETITTFPIHSITHYEDMVFIHDDLGEFHARKRVNHYLRQSGSPKHVLLMSVSESTAKQIFGISKSQIVKASSLEAPPVNPRLKKAGVDVDNLDEQIEFYNKHILLLGYKWQDTIVPKGKTEYYYIDLKNTTPQYKNEPISNLDDMIIFLRNCCGMTIEGVYGVRSAATKFAEDSDKWINIYDVFVDKMKKYLDDNDIVEYAVREHVQRSILPDLIKIKTTLSLNNTAVNSDICKRIIKMQTDSEIPSTYNNPIQYWKMRELASKIGKDLPYDNTLGAQVLAKEAEQIKSDFHKEFPLMQHLQYNRYGYYTQDNEILKEYLRLWSVDKECKNCAV